MFLESISEDGQLATGLEATEGFLGLQQAGGGPSERHLGVSPAFDVAGDLAHRAERVLYDVGAGERAPEFVRQAEADDGEDLVQPLQDAARDARFLMLQTPDLSTAEQNRSKGRRKTGPFSVMRYAVLRVVPLVHRRAPRCFA